MGLEDPPRRAYTNAEITRAFLAALDEFRNRQPIRPTQEALTSLMGVTPGSMSQWKKGTDVGTSTLVSALIRLEDLTLILGEYSIGLCNHAGPTPGASPQRDPQQLELFLDYQFADAPTQDVQTRPIELDQAEEVVLRISVRRASLPPPNAASECA
jgi:hypothetical protein